MCEQTTPCNHLIQTALYGPLIEMRISSAFLQPLDALYMVSCVHNRRWHDRLASDESSTIKMQITTEMLTKYCREGKYCRLKQKLFWDGGLVTEKMVMKIASRQLHTIRLLAREILLPLTNCFSTLITTIANLENTSSFLSQFF